MKGGRFFTFVGLVLFFTLADGINQFIHDFINKYENMDADKQSYIHEIEQLGPNVAVLNSFESLDVEIKLEEFPNLKFVSIHDDFLSCTHMLQFYLKIKQNGDDAYIECEIGKNDGTCLCGESEFQVKLRPTSKHIVIENKIFVVMESQTFKQIFEECKQNTPFAYTTEKHQNHEFIKAQSHIGVTQYYPGYDYNDRCFFALVSSSKDANPFNVVRPKPSTLQPDSHHQYLYSTSDVPAELAPNISFVKDGWPRIEVQTNKENQRMTFLKPADSTHIPAFLFDIPKCHGTTIIMRLFDREDCTYYIYQTDFLRVTPRGFEDYSSSSKIDKAKLSEQALYYRSPFIRTASPLQKPLEYNNDILCKHKIGDKYVVEFLEVFAHKDLGCDSFGFVTGPAVKVEIEYEEPNVTTTTESSTYINSSTEIPIESASFSPWFLAIIVVMFLLLSAGAIIYLTRRKWFKEARMDLDENAFAHHWQVPVPDKVEDENDRVFD